MTPPEVAAVRDGSQADSPGWQVRVVPNLYPPFSMDEGSTDLSNPLRELGPALGACEVIIHSTEHASWLPYLTSAQAELIMQVTWDRYRAHSAGAGSVVALYNHGKDAGASLAHPHGQLFATRVTAPVLEEELAGAEDAYRRAQTCVFCDMIVDELDAKDRVVVAADGMVVIMPWASRAAYECWIIPTMHQADFGQSLAGDVEALGRTLRETLWRLTQVVGEVPLNWYIHSLPNPAGETINSYHWHLEIRPHLGIAAGFELATGTFINTVAPEDAAAAMRAADAPPSS
jgi:UDPglucose--hexose-1-phosphate uridylyltransferase